MTEGTERTRRAAFALMLLPPIVGGVFISIVAALASRGAQPPVAKPFLPQQIAVIVDAIQSAAVALPEPAAAPASAPPATEEAQSASLSDHDNCGAVRTLRFNVTRFAEILECRRPIRYHSTNLTITLRARDYRNLAAAEALIERTGYRPQTIYPLPPGWGISMTLGQLDSATRYVMLQGFTNGLHCCVNVYVAVPEGPNRGIYPVDSFEAGTEISFDGPPTDVDGDSVTDFVGQDNRFYYEFTSYSGTEAPPPRIWNVQDGHIVDVSNTTRYRRLFEQSASALRQLCVHPDADYWSVRGACPQYVAAAARLGRFEQAWREMLSVYSIEARPSGCPTWNESDVICRDLPTHLIHFLRNNGYLTARDARRAIPPIHISRIEGSVNIVPRTGDKIISGSLSL